MFHLSSELQQNQNTQQFILKRSIYRRMRYINALLHLYIIKYLFRNIYKVLCIRGKNMLKGANKNK